LIEEHKKNKQTKDDDEDEDEEDDTPSQKVASTIASKPIQTPLQQNMLPSFSGMVSVPLQQPTPPAPPPPEMPAKAQSTSNIVFVYDDNLVQMVWIFMKIEYMIIGGKSCEKREIY
jgi:hypothetical protein